MKTFKQFLIEKKDAYSVAFKKLWGSKGLKKHSKKKWRRVDGRWLREYLEEKKIMDHKKHRERKVKLARHSPEQRSRMAIMGRNAK